MTFGSAAEYLAFQRPDVSACLVLDLDLPHGLKHSSSFEKVVVVDSHSPLHHFNLRVLHEH
jgi:FixJ family two-component response regulator